MQIYTQIWKNPSKESIWEALYQPGKFPVYKFSKGFFVMYNENPLISPNKITI